MLHRPIIREKNVACSSFSRCPPYTEAHKNVSVRYDESQLKGMFVRFDTNGDGLLSKEELRHAFKALGSRAPGVRAFLALFRADRNRDGHIDDSEFDILVKYALKLGYSIK